ncbi:MAG: hypothetical protein ABR543_11985 [Gemmatimonadaceae bacterium]
MAGALPADSARRPLRVALLVDSLRIPKWAHDVIRDIAEASFLELVLVVRRKQPSTQTARTGPVGRRWDHLLYILYNRLDQRFFAGEPDPFRESDATELLSSVPVIGVTPCMTKHCDYFDDRDIEAIESHDIDVAIRFGFRILKGKALTIARHGVWSYHHGDNRTNRGGPAGFWEVMEGRPVTGSILQVLTEDLDAGTVIYRSYASTDPRSVVRNKRNFYWKSAAFLMRKLRDLHAEGSKALTDPSGMESALAPYSHRLYVTPGNLEMARHLAGLAERFVGDKLRAVLAPEQWALAFRITKELGDGDNVPDVVPHRFKVLRPPKDRFWADPFPVRIKDRYLLFFEEMVYREGKAHIAVAEVDSKGMIGTPRRVLERPYHLSYPFLFEWEGERYMIPESGANRTVELYRALEFPDRWEPAGILLSNVRAVDATLAEMRGRWWMFVNIGVEGASSCDELHLFHSATPLGPWTPHRRNPVKSDVRSARPAGRIFSRNGDYYRPSQDCSISYGHAIVINRITRIDDDSYGEVEVGRLTPDWRPDVVGTHTINAADGLTVIDARLRRSRFS